MSSSSLLLVWLALLFPVALCVVAPSPSSRVSSSPQNAVRAVEQPAVGVVTANDRESVSVDLPVEGEEYPEPNALKERLLAKRSRNATASATKFAAGQPHSVWDELQYPDLWQMLQDRSPPKGTEREVPEVAKGLVGFLNISSVSALSTMLFLGEPDAQVATAVARLLPPDVTIVSVAPNETAAYAHVKTVLRSGQDRVMVAQAPVSLETASMLADSAFFAQYIVLWDLDELLKTSVPADVEAFLAKVLVLAENVVIRAPNEAKLGPWRKSVQVLLQTCIERSGVSASVSYSAKKNLFKASVSLSTRAVKPFSRYVIGDVQEEWTMRFDKTLKLPTPFPVVLVDPRGRVVPVAMVGVSLDVLGALKLSHVSVRTLFVSFISSDVGSRFVLPSSAEVFKAGFDKLSVPKASYDMFFGNKGPYKSPMFITDSKSFNITDLWVCGDQLFFDPVVSIYERFPAATPPSSADNSGNGDDGSRSVLEKKPAVSASEKKAARERLLQAVEKEVAAAAADNAAAKEEEVSAPKTTTTVVPALRKEAEEGVRSSTTLVVPNEEPRTTTVEPRAAATGKAAQDAAPASNSPSSGRKLFALEPDGDNAKRNMEIMAKKKLVDLLRKASKSATTIENFEEEESTNGKVPSPPETPLQPDGSVSSDAFSPLRARVPGTDQEIAAPPRRRYHRRKQLDDGILGIAARRKLRNRRKFGGGGGGLLDEEEGRVARKNLDDAGGFGIDDLESENPFVLLSEFSRPAQRSTALSHTFNLLQPSLSAENADFSMLFHQSGDGALPLKIAKAFPDSLVVSYDSSTDMALAHAVNAVSMGVTNNLIGNPLQYGSTNAHDATERVLFDVRSSLDLFDFQFVGPDFFAAMLHHPQDKFEQFLGQVFSLSRTTFISVPHLSTLQQALALFGDKPLDTRCYDAGERRDAGVKDIKDSVAQELARRVLGLLYCSADAANVEVKARVISPVKRTSRGMRREDMLVEVLLVSMTRPVGGMFKYMEEEGSGPHGRDVEKLEGTVATGNYRLEYKRSVGNGESYSLIRKDGRTSLLWRSQQRGKGSAAGPLQKGRGVSIYTLLAIRPIPTLRRDLAQMYLRDADNIISPLRNLAGRAEPWCTYYYRNALYYVWPFARDAEGQLVESLLGELEDLKAEATVEQNNVQVALAAGMGIAFDVAALQNNSFDSRFSFVEHGAPNGFASATVAKVFRNSSVILITAENATRIEILRVLRRNALQNTLVLTQSGLEDYAVDMAASPEHFNFQYFPGFYDAWRKDQEGFDGVFEPELLGAQVACAQASYFLMPHPRIMSLALAVFHGPDPALRVYGAPSHESRNRHVDHFASAASGEADAVDRSILDLYELSAHPDKTPLKDWDVTLVRSRISSAALKRVSVNRLPVPMARVGVTLRDVKKAPSGRWALVRVTPERVSRVVQHHFRAEQDGHKRRYALNHVFGEIELQRAVNGELSTIEKAWHEVSVVPGIGRTWLQRMSDGGQAAQNSLIPYTHFGLSLITILRMGVDDATKERMYGEFLQIPVHEDMATWNIQWASGRLAYVDVDTMQYHFEKVLPDAYKMIVALMNYERTVSDFGKCESPSKTQFGVPYIGSCIKPKFEVRDDDEMRRDLGCTVDKPVPCPDGTCKATFVHCLRDVYEKRLAGEPLKTKKKSKKKKRAHKKKGDFDGMEKIDDAQAQEDVLKALGLQAEKKAAATDDSNDSDKKWTPWSSSRRKRSAPRDMFRRRQESMFDAATKKEM